ncbi:MAG TPA: response regulator transcription factor [Candidatus Polarisedimenticolaceae bacterium]|nr:response regulator transcription factor [Candidatus Polarisedimenticolaceae bacterium]
MNIETSSVRILVVDDHAILRQGLRMLVEAEAGFSIIGEADDGSRALALAASEQPDIVVLDIDLGSDNGLDLIAGIQAAAPRARIVILTGLRDVETHRRAFRLGARGLVVKEAAAHTLMKAIRKVHEGEIWLDRTSTAHLLAEMSKPTPPPPQNPEAAKIAKLSARELEVTAMLAEGLSNKLIADRLSISETTVRHHLTSIFAKLGVPDRLALLLYAHRNGLVKPPQVG